MKYIVNCASVVFILFHPGIKEQEEDLGMLCYLPSPFETVNNVERQADDRN